jgi:hypothetical protein
MLPDLLFHGTSAEFDTPRIGADGLFWTAERSNVAQNYIPIACTTCATPHVFRNELTVRVAPHRFNVFYTVVLMMGHQATDIKYDHQGRANSFSFAPDYPTYGDVVQYIEQHLGYVSATASPKSYQIRTKGWDGEGRHDIIAPADYKKPGFLLIVSGHHPMKIAELTEQGYDSTNPQYLALPVFDRLRRQGYDGVVIDDICQSKTQGNVEHRSIGFFQHAIDRLRIQTIPATHFDWDANQADLSANSDTPEFTRWNNASKAARLVEAQTMPERQYTMAQLRQKAQRRPAP